MSDDIWRDRRDDDDFSEFGSLFDEAEPTQNIDEVADEVADEERLSFDDDASGPLPHWTEPATGEVPRFDSADSGDPAPEDDHDLDVWSSFSSDAPIWKDDAPVEPDPQESAPTGRHDAVPPAAAPQRRANDRHDEATERHRQVSDEHARVSGQQPRVSGQQPRVSGQQPRVSGQHDAVAREPSRITIGTDPSGMVRPPDERRRRGGGGRSRPAPAPGAPPSSGRDMPAAVAVGLLLAAVFVAALMYDPRAVVAVITLILGLAAVEFYDKVSEKGYRPAVVPGVASCIAAPLACYWLGVGTLPLVLAFAFMATSASFVGAKGVEAGPMPNASITTLGIAWIGLLGSFAVLILRLSTRDYAALGETSFDVPRLEHIGTDTLFLTALGVVANDVGALFIGSAAGRTPLRRWVSPNKTVEGLIGGSFFTIIVLLFVGISDSSDTWSSPWHLVALALVISALAPMGDLVESMFKRNLDVKDFGTIVKGHGGVLDRFDGFLFALPGVYYLTLVLEPWTEFVPA